MWNSISSVPDCCLSSTWIVLSNSAIRIQVSQPLRQTSVSALQLMFVSLHMIFLLNNVIVALSICSDKDPGLTAIKTDVRISFKANVRVSLYGLPTK